MRRFRYPSQVWLAAGLVLLLSSLVSQSSYAQEYSPEVQTAIRRADSIFEQGQYESAKRSYLNVLELEPKCPDAYNGIGLCFYRLGQKDEALQNYKRALEIDSRHYRTLFNAGNLYFVDNRYDESLSYFLRAKDAFGSGREDPDLLTMIGIVYCDKAQHEPDVERKMDHKRALACFTRAIELKPGLPTAHANLGKLYMQMGESARAEQELRTAVTLNPRYSFAYFILGELEKGLHHLPEALIAYSRSLSTEEHLNDREETLEKIVDLGIPKSVAEHFSRGYESLSERRYDAAEAEFRTVAASPGPMQHVAWNNIGYTRSRRGQTAEALAAYQQALKLAPKGFAQPHYNSGQLLLLQGKLDEAERAFNRAISESGGNYSLAHNALGIILARKGKYQEALRHYNLAQMQAGDSLPVIHFNKGVLQQSQKQTTEARNSFERYLRLAPKGSNADAAKRQLAGLKG